MKNWENNILLDANLKLGTIKASKPPNAPTTPKLQLVGQEHFSLKQDASLTHHNQYTLLC